MTDMRLTKNHKLTQRGRFIDLDVDKLRGGYYTSPEVAAWLAEWAIRKKTDRVLEPSCGDGAFLKAATRRLSGLGAPAKTIAKNLIGVEIIESEASKARTYLHSHFKIHGTNNVVVNDFFAWWQTQTRPAYDAVIGNPPFIRYQSFPEPHRSRAMDMITKLGLSPNRLMNIWVPFVAVATASLKPEGRLALVLPAELLQVSYASQLRSYLTDHFTRLDIVACNELFFPDAEQEVVLFLAEGALSNSSEQNICRVAMTETPTLSEALSQPASEVVKKSIPKTVRHESEKWLKYFLTDREISFMRSLRESSSVTTLGTHASVDVGVVTGKNEFFVLSGEVVDELGLSQHTLPIVSRSIQLKGSRLNHCDWTDLSSKGDHVYLLYLNSLNGSKLSRSLENYIREGERKGVHKGYKCSIRDPWYTVPSVWNPDGFMFRQIYDFPRVVQNRAGATSTDTIHRLRCKAKPERVIASIYTHLTAASAEIEGRSYGGGVLELEPTEAERLLVPANLGKAISISESDQLIRAGRIEEVLLQNDRLILKDEMGLSKSECNLLREIWVKMRNRRMARRRRGRAVAVTESAL